MKNISEYEYLKSEYAKINNLFLKGKFNLVIEKSKKLIRKYPKQLPFYNLLALEERITILPAQYSVEQAFSIAQPLAVIGMPWSSPIFEIASGYKEIYKAF